jgi:hypothetical protein
VSKKKKEKKKLSVRERGPSGGYACEDFNQVKVKCHVHMYPTGAGPVTLWMADALET